MFGNIYENYKDYSCALIKTDSVCMCTSIGSQLKGLMASKVPVDPN